MGNQLKRRKKELEISYPSWAYDNLCIMINLCIGHIVDNIIGCIVDHVIDKVYQMYSGTYSEQYVLCIGCIMRCIVDQRTCLSQKNEMLQMEYIYISHVLFDVAIKEIVCVIQSMTLF